jgi:hypothetical protein
MKVLEKLYNGIKSTLANNVPVHRTVYAVTGGDYLGEFLVYVEERVDTYYFLSLPKMDIRQIAKSDVVDGLESKLLDKVERLPKDVFSLCYEQYVHSQTNHETEEIVPNKPQLDT